MPGIIIAGAAGFGFKSGEAPQMVYLIQTAMLLAGIATLLQMLGLCLAAIGARLSLVHSTCFSYIR
ncbi:hypothetical protein [Novosphingobium gossypii]|uniref:hypothetical protein n=1 Tax=Novosphingobium gossypii TaxID=1604774 RepID=UPI003D1F900F